MRRLLTILIFLYPSYVLFAQNANLIVGSGAYYSGGVNAYTVIAGDIKNDGNISTPFSNLKAIGTTLQHVGCYTLSGSYCPNIFNISVYNTILGTVDQQNNNGVAIETNTLVMGTHIFTNGSTEIREGNYWLYNSSTPFSGNNTSSKFFVTTGSYHGLLKQSNVNSGTLFPIGTSATSNNYTPITIKYSAGTDSFGVRVFNNVYYSYKNTINGDPVNPGSITNARFVEKTWIVSKSTTVTGGYSTAGFTATLQWNAVNENGYFTPSRDDDISVARNHDVMWFPQSPQGPSTNPYGAGPYTRTDVITYDNAFYEYYPITVSAINHVLPVIGLNLTGRLVGENAELKWATVTEENTDYFNIEHSTDGSRYNTIGQIDAYGNSTVLRNYNFIDSFLNSPLNYYRIKAVDKDGKSMLSNTIIIKTTPASKGIILLTNPAITDINILFKNSSGDYTIDIFDNLGNKVRTEKAEIVGLSQIYKLSRETITAGMYYIRVYNHQTKEITMFKVVLL